VTDRWARLDAAARRPPTIALTAGQWEVVKRAVDRLRLEEQAPSITTGRALELICADYLAG
jgi:hypothetical protein